MEGNNKLIAEFLGYNIWSWDNENFYITRGKAPNEINHNINSLKFSYNWDWLMEVVQRIESINKDRQLLFEVQISGTDCAIQAHESVKGVPCIFWTEKTKIEAVYGACIEFIKWFNKQN